MKSVLGFFNRPWIALPFEAELDAIAATGAKDMGLLGKPGGGIFVEWNTPFEEIAKMKDAIQSRGLRMQSLLAHTRFDVPVSEAISCYKAFIDRAAALGAPNLLEMGAHDSNLYDMYFTVMRAVAPYAQDKGIKIAVKPHGGLSTTGEQCVQVVEKVNHPNYSLWYDPGNIIYYTQLLGNRLDPVVEARKMKGIVTGMCVKDCRVDADGKPDVNVTPGEGLVDFEGVFRALMEAGFKGGPCIVETLGPIENEAEITAAGKNTFRYIGDIMTKVGL